MYATPTPLLIISLYRHVLKEIFSRFGTKFLQINVGRVLFLNISIKFCRLTFLRVFVVHRHQLLLILQILLVLALIVIGILLLHNICLLLFHPILLNNIRNVNGSIKDNHDMCY